VTFSGPHAAWAAGPACMWTRRGSRHHLPETDCTVKGPAGKGGRISGAL